MKIRLEDMTPAEKVNEDVVLCPVENCFVRGIYINCYLHTYVGCEEYQWWHNRTNPEKREKLTFKYAERQRKNL